MKATILCPDGHKVTIEAPAEFDYYQFEIAVQKLAGVLNGEISSLEVS